MYMWLLVLGFGVELSSEIQTCTQALLFEAARSKNRDLRVVKGFTVVRYWTQNLAIVICIIASEISLICYEAKKVFVIPD